ncbi:PASTA domain-containing protein [Streptomyces gilvosporeus]|uniref:PASTA domain-containing protein n=1 Tax=Streptomyces gilvosporeus TaxID=553510 RepID=UPI00193A76C2|nr:PASTA domain-containing protein [Streptomyces gilvosporeus]
MKKTVVTAALALSAGIALAIPAQAHTGLDPHTGTMPDVKGKDLVTAYQTLHYDLRVRFSDGLGKGRHVLWPAAWKVCDQQPAAGAHMAGPHMDELKITLTVVKEDERCSTPRGANRHRGSGSHRAIGREWA